MRRSTLWLPGPPPGRCPTNTIALSGSQVVTFSWVVTVTGEPVTGSVEEITTSASSIAGMPSASIAHIAHTSAPLAIRTRRVGVVENG